MVSFSALASRYKISPSTHGGGLAKGWLAEKKLEQRLATMNGWNQKNAGISGEINVMRWFDSSEKTVTEATTVLLLFPFVSSSYWFPRIAYTVNSSGSTVKESAILNDHLLIIKRVR